MQHVRPEWPTCSISENKIYDTRKIKTVLLRAIEKDFKELLSEKVYNYEKYLLKTLKFEEPYVGTSVENQIWRSDRMAGVHISDI